MRADICWSSVTAAMILGLRYDGLTESNFSKVHTFR